MFDALATGLISIANGLLDFAGMALSLRTILILATLISLAWLAACEVEEMDRQGLKPTIRQH